MSEYKLHIIATTNQNVKVDAYWYEVGEKIDCYLTPHQFKTYINAFDDWDIIPPVDVIKAEKEIIIDEDIKNVQDNQIPKRKPSGKNPKETTI